MHVVAVTRWGPPFAGELPALSARLGVVAYDLRLQLAGELPRVFTRVEDGAEALGHVEFLRGRGHGAVTCDAETVPGPEDHIVPVDFELASAAVRVVSTRGQRFELAFADVFAMVHATAIAEAERTVTSSEKKLSLGRAVLSGGMVMRKTVDRVETTVTAEEERRIYMFCRSRPVPFVWSEHTLHWDGLGERRELTTAQNFVILSKTLEELTPEAFHDQRLLTHKRRADISALRGGAKDRRVESSNARENDLAAFLLVRGYLEGQL